MNLRIVGDLASFLSAKFNVPKEKINIQLEICPANMEGELTVNCFKLVPILKSRPDTVTDAVLEFISSHDDVISAGKIKAFVNFVLKVASLYRDTISKPRLILESAKFPEKDKRRVLIEYSAPNTNKPLHLGHLRNNTLGMSLASLLKRAGHDVFAVNLINDRGIHICKSMLAYMRFGNGDTPESTGKKGDHFVGDFYVKFDQALRKELAELREARPDLKDKSDEDLFALTAIGQEAQEILRKWENGDPETIALWKMMNEWVINGFSLTYKRMGVTFDKVYFESDTYKMGKDVAVSGEKAGLFKRRDDGAIIADLKPFGLTEKVLLRSDNTSVYITQDIGTTLMKDEDFHPDQQIWVVGDEQIHHFKTLFAILKVLGYKWADKLYHLAYGMINLPSGKMKSREGTVVDADNLFDDMHELAKNAAIERLGENIPEDIDRRSEMIAMGALKFMLLKFNPKTTIMFDPQASIKFEGDTGPYVQYVCARINSILRKYSTEGKTLSPEVNWGLMETKYEKQLAIVASLYPEALLSAAEKLDCSVLVNYLLDLAKAYNSFYRECSVLNAETEDLKMARIALSSAVRDIIADGLKTLTIDIPEAM
ncbi:MAG TPA: arginine--tRNA ligase [Lentisphaeria bacterium]|nr:MAG: arginine--tRNA ligase [Lentisphaerae bacterium GWF2_38_69]HBM17388.1 arginine--tRNA ligase [Lentisphaeria bacterium]